MAIDLVKYLRIKYEHLGRGWNSGDCFNLLLLFYKEELDIALADFTDYSENWASEGKNYFLDLYKKYKFKKISDNYQIGDVVFFSNSKGIISHVGIVIDPLMGYFIHTTKQGTAVHKYLTGQWADKFMFGIRHKDRIHVN